MRFLLVGSILLAPKVIVLGTSDVSGLPPCFSLAGSGLKPLGICFPSLEASVCRRGFMSWFMVCQLHVNENIDIDGSTRR